MYNSKDVRGYLPFSAAECRPTEAVIDVEVLHRRTDDEGPGAGQWRAQHVHGFSLLFLHQQLLGLRLRAATPI